MSLISQMRQLVAEHDAAHNAAFQLWTWLPSYQFAQIAHGDYADETANTTHENIMKEAAMVFAYLKGHKLDFDALETREWFGCSCGECPAPSREAIQTQLGTMIGDYDGDD